VLRGLRNINAKWGSSTHQPPNIAEFDTRVQFRHFSGPRSGGQKCQLSPEDAARQALKLAELFVLGWAERLHTAWRSSIVQGKAVSLAPFIMQDAYRQWIKTKKVEVVKEVGVCCAGCHTEFGSVFRQLSLMDFYDKPDHDVFSGACQQVMQRKGATFLCGATFHNSKLPFTHFKLFQVNETLPIDK